jgi:hypothetical protein
MYRIDRRRFLTGLGASAASAATLSLGRPARASGDLPKFLIVLTGSGGASLIDGPLALRASESRNAARINTFPDARVWSPEGSPLRAVDLARDEVGPIPIGFSARQSDFVRRHHREMLVSTVRGSSVNHGVGQRRSVTGNEAWLGRTLQEVTALTHGEGFPLPNVHLATGTAFTERGTDDSLPASCFGEQVADPSLWPLSLDGTRGLEAPRRDLVEAARALRDERLDPASRFYRVFSRSPRLAQWRERRGAPLRAVEQAQLIEKLMVFPDSEDFPLSQYGLAASPAAARVREVFPNYRRDPLEAQAALAFLLLLFRVSVTVTLGPGFDLVLDRDGDVSGLPDGSMKNTPIAFDFSHQSHRATQALMWDRLYRVADGLISLLKEEELARGTSLWDRSVLYFATEFGRTRTRPENAEDFGTAHDLDNGALVVSPLVRGNTVLGGVDPDTGLGYGYDPVSGAPDPNRTMAERHIYAGLLDVLGVDTAGSGLPDVRAFRRV